MTYTQKFRKKNRKARDMIELIIQSIWAAILKRREMKYDRVDNTEYLSSDTKERKSERIEKLFGL